MKRLQKILFACVIGMIAMCFQTHAAEYIQPIQIDSFITPLMQEITVMEQETLEEVKAKLPDILEAVSMENEEIFVPVRWECIGDYEETDYFYYQFKPVINFDAYEIPENIQVPYLWVLREASDGVSRAVTKHANETVIYNFMINELKCNLATALGILANIERESGFNPKATANYNGKTYYGICQWSSDRLTDLIDFCSKNGYSEDTLEGQLRYLKYELYGNEKKAWGKMQGIDNTAEGAYLAGYNWATYFERCAVVYREVSAIRARDVYWPKYAAENAAPVYRVFGSNRYETSMKIAEQLKKILNLKKFDHVIVATGTGFADALSGSYLANVKNAPILLINERNSSKVINYIQTNLNDQGIIYLLGGENAVSKQFEQKLEGYQVKRLDGKNRYETNLKILEETGMKNKELLVCTGKEFADSLSASAVGKPILLVSDHLSELQKEYLEILKPNQIYIVGGEKAVSEEIQLSLEGYGNCIRIAGDNRYETSVFVAETFFEKPEYAILTYSQNFPDGLCGGALAVKLKAPLILTMANKETAAKEYIQDVTCKNGYVLGGTGLISDNTVKKIFRIDGEKVITFIE